MTHRTKRNVIKIFNREFTFQQLTFLFVLVAGTFWMLFNLSCSINTKYFSASTAPAEINSEHVHINNGAKK